MKRLIPLLILFFWVGGAFGQTTIPEDTSFVWSWEGMDDGKVYHIAVPCTGVTAADTFVTWAMDLSKYRGLSISYYYDTAGAWTDSSLWLQIGYQQSFQRLDTTFSVPYAHSWLETNYNDSTGAFTYKEIYPTSADFVRFFIYPKVGMDQDPAARLHLYIKLSKSPMSYIKQGGIGWFTDWRIRSPSSGTLGPKWFHAFVTENGDTIHFKWEGGGPNRRSVWDNSVYFNDTCRPRSMFHLDGEMSWGGAKNKTLTGSPACTLSLSGNDNAVMHKIDCASATATLSQIVDGHGAAVNEGMYVILSLKNVNDTLVIDHFDGAGKNLFLGHDDTLFGTADRAFFIEDNNDRFTGFVTKRVASSPSGIHLDYGVFNDSVQTAFLRATDSAVVATLLRCPDITATDSLTTARAIASDSANIGTLLRCPDITATDSLTTARAIASDSANVGTLLRCPDIVASDSVTTARVIATDSVNVTTLLRTPLLLATDSAIVTTLIRCPDITATDSLTTSRAIASDSANVGTLLRVPLLLATDSAIVTTLTRCPDITATDSLTTSRVIASDSVNVTTLLRCPDIVATDSLTTVRLIADSLNAATLIRSPLVAAADSVIAGLIRSDTVVITPYIDITDSVVVTAILADSLIAGTLVRTPLLIASDSINVTTLLRCPDITATDSLTSARLIADSLNAGTLVRTPLLAASDSIVVTTLLRCPDVTATDSLTSARLIADSLNAGTLVRTPLLVASDSINVTTLLRCPDVTATDSLTTARLIADSLNAGTLVRSPLVVASDSIVVTTLLRCPDIVVADSITTSIVRADSIHIGTLRMTEGEVSTPDSILAGRFHASDSITVGTLLRCPDITATDSLTTARLIADSLNAGTLVRTPLLVASDSINVTTLLRCPDITSTDSLTTARVITDSVNAATVVRAALVVATDSLNVTTLLRCPDITATDSLTTARLIADSLNAGTLVRTPLLVASDSAVITTLLRCAGNIMTSNALALGVAAMANMTGIVAEGGVLGMKEISTPTADATYGKVYTKTDNNLYFQDGDGTEHTILKGSSSIQHEFFTPLEAPTGTVGNWDIIAINAAQSVHFSCQIPEDFETLDAATVVMIPDASETIQWDVLISVAAAGEAHDNDDRSALDETLVVTADQITEADISGSLTGLSAGDYISIDFQSDTGDLRIVGFEFDFN